MNDTRRTHEFVDFIAQISADKSVSFDFTNNERLAQSGFALENATVNGYINENGDVTLNLNSKKSLEKVVGHEITHILEGTKLYDALAETITEYAKSKKATNSKFTNEYNQRFDEVKKLYENVNGYEGVEGVNKIKKEVVADLVGDYLFTDTDFINHLSTSNRNLFQKLYDEIKYLCKIVTAGSKEARKLEKVKKAFEDAYRANIKKDTKAKTASSENTQDTVRYSLMNAKTLSENVDEIMSMSDGEARKRKSEGEYITVNNHTPSVILNNVSDAKDIPVIIRFDAAYLAIRHDGVLEGNYHNYGSDFAEKLTSVMENPDAIVRLDNGRLNLLGRVESNKGHTSIVSIELNTVKDINNKNSAYNLVVSMLPAKGNYVNNILSKRAVDIEYQKEDLSQVNPQLHKSLSTINDKSSIDSISQTTQDVNTNSENSPKFSLSPQIEQNYLEAVNSGDMEVAQKMVDEAAKAAGYTIKAYHGTTNRKETSHWNEQTKTFDTDYEKFTVFKKQYDEQVGHFFASDKDNAGGYGSTVYDVFLNLSNPLEIDCNNGNYDSITYNGMTKSTEEWAEYAKKNGYNGVIFKNVRDGVGYKVLDLMPFCRRIAV